jgi:hypothetical protein
MKRYFKKFNNADPMEELTERAALERGRYTVEDDASLRRYRRIIEHKLDSIVYQGWDDPSEPIADLARLDEPVEAEIHSTVEPRPDNGHRWKIWYLDAQRRIIKILEPEFDAEGNFRQQNLYSPTGALIHYTIYHYDRDGYLLELITHAPDGTEIGRQDA